MGGVFRINPRVPLWGAAALLSGAVPALTAASEPAPAARASEADVTFFESRIRPLMAKQCFACHSEKVRQGGLRLDEASALMKGGDSGPAVVPGKPDESRLVRALHFTDEHLQMPPAGKLPDADIELLTEWVRRGAYFPPKAEAPGAKPTAPKPKPEAHWAFQPLSRTNPPATKLKGWASRRADSYLLAKLEKSGLRPSPAADARTLVRRAYFDLIGLPPTPEEVEAFVREVASEAHHGDTETRRRAESRKAGPSRATRGHSRPLAAGAPKPQSGKPSAPNRKSQVEDRRSAYERLVDRLLASPHYGERWGRHWLDLVRYCDVPEAWAQTEAQAWRYRDWVVQALNADLPYNQFVLRQLAADELPGLPPSELAALGFLGLSPSYWKELKLHPDVIKSVVAEEWEERINTVSGTLLGVTVACARCHDHKTEPISQQDYYALAGVFASTKLAARPLLPPSDAQRVVAARTKAKELEEEVKRLRDAAKADAAKAAELNRQADAVQVRLDELKRTPSFDAPTVYAVETASIDVLPDGPDRTKVDYRDGTGQDVCVQVRGNPAIAGPVVPRRYLTVLSRGEPARFNRGSGRLDLGEAIFRDSAPLAARIIVNRVWRHHFGKGLVETPSNFGISGDRPTHPELLDDLAGRFIQAGWSLKWLHREIMLSSAYRQSSRPSAKLMAVDPENRLLGRMSRRRLEVEAWRDAILATAGNLDAKLGGAPQELSAAENRRRTIYGMVRRRDLDDLLRLYDFPDPMAHSPARFHTTTPLQQLFVLNSDFVGRQAAALAARVRGEASDLPGQISRAYMLLYGRLPSASELKAAEGFLSANGAAADEQWKQYAEVLLARSELMFIE